MHNHTSIYNGQGMPGTKVSAFNTHAYAHAHTNSHTNAHTPTHTHTHTHLLPKAFSDYSVRTPWVKLRENSIGVVDISLTLEPEPDEMSRESFRLELVEESGIVPRNVFFRGAEVVILDVFGEDQP